MCRVFRACLSVTPGAAGDWCAGQAYREIGEKIRRNGFRFWEGRIVVTPAEKVLRSIDSLSYFKNRFAKTDCHDMSLHADLEGLPYVSNQRA